MNRQDSQREARAGKGRQDNSGATQTVAESNKKEDEKELHHPAVTSHSAVVPLLPLKAE